MPVPRRQNFGERSFLSNKEVDLAMQQGVEDGIKKEIEKKYKYREYEVTKETHKFLSWLEEKVGDEKMTKMFEALRIEFDYDGNLIGLNCSFTGLDCLKYLPETLRRLSCSGNKITNLDDLPAKLKYLDCLDNSLTSLDSLPVSLEELDCSGNKIVTLDNMGPNLKKLICSYNKLTKLDELPGGLEELYCSYNEITHLEHLPVNLQVLICHDTELVSLFASEKSVPEGLYQLNCTRTKMSIEAQNRVIEICNKYNIMFQI